MSKFMYPYEITIDGSRANDDQYWRINKIHRLLGYAQALADNDNNEDFYKKIESIYDEKGSLTITWIEKPTEQEKEYLQKAWESIVTDFEGDKIEHPVKKGGIIKTYTEDETIQKLKAELKKGINTIYNSDCINRKGKTKDTNEFYTEILAHELLKNLNNFEDIKQKTRNKTYFPETHNKISLNKKSKREEEKFAERITNLNLDKLGEIIDYQIPLEDKQSDKMGKIDLISINKGLNTIYLIELKYIGNEETLLRAILEIYTYYKIIDESKLKKNLSKELSIDIDGFSVIPAVLVVSDCIPHKELEEMELGKRPKLKALSIALGVKFFTLEISVYESQL